MKYCFRYQTLESHYTKTEKVPFFELLIPTFSHSMLLPFHRVICNCYDCEDGCCCSCFINLMTDESNENIMQMFFDTLSELTVLDSDTLRMYELSSDINITDVVDKYGINYDQVKLVKEKLVRLGLLSRKNDEVRDANLDEITVYLQNMEKDLKKKNPKGVKLSNKVKKISGNESYRITRLGVGFLKSISE